MTTREYGVRDLGDDTARVVAAVEAGDRVFLTYRGKRVAELRPVPEEDLDRLMGLADRVSPDDTGAFADLMQSKQDDLDAQRGPEADQWR